MSFQIGIIPLFLIAISFVFGLKEKNIIYKRMYWYCMGFVVSAVILMLSISTFFWENLPLLSYVQYPWRFLSIIIPVIAFTGAYISHSIGMRFWSIILVISAVVFSYSYIRPVIYAPRNGEYYTSRINFTDGTSSMGNSFSTIWTGWKKVRAQYVLEVINGKVPGGILENSYLRKTFTVLSDAESEVYVPILYYPGWKVIIDNNETPIDYITNGTVRFAVPQGKHRITVEFTQTPIRFIADLISIITLVWLLGWGILRIYANRHRHIPA